MSLLSPLSTRRVFLPVAASRLPLPSLAPDRHPTSFPPPLRPRASFVRFRPLPASAVPAPVFAAPACAPLAPRLAHLHPPLPFCCPLKSSVSLHFVVAPRFSFSLPPASRTPAAGLLSRPRVRQAFAVLSKRLSPLPCRATRRAPVVRPALAAGLARLCNTLLPPRSFLLAPRPLSLWPQRETLPRLAPACQRSRHHSLTLPSWAPFPFSMPPCRNFPPSHPPARLVRLSPRPCRLPPTDEPQPLRRHLFPHPDLRPILPADEGASSLAPRCQRPPSLANPPPVPPSRAPPLPFLQVPLLRGADRGAEIGASTAVTPASEACATVRRKAPAPRGARGRRAHAPCRRRRDAPRAVANAPNPAADSALARLLARGSHLASCGRVAT